MVSDTRPPLNRDRIAEAALALIDEAGIDALTMRRLGERLGYEAMAIYKHLPDKNAVIDAAVVRAYAEMSPPAPSAPWDDQLRVLATELRKIAVGHPHLFVRLITQPPAHPVVAERIDATLHALRQVRDDADFVARQFWFFIGYTSGALLGETSSMINLNAAAAAPVGPTADSEFAVECPALATFGQALNECDFGADYAAGIESTITAISQAARR